MSTHWEIWKPKPRSTLWLHVCANSLARALADILGESEVEIPGVRLCKVEVKALANILADSLT